MKKSGQLCFEFYYQAKEKIVKKVGVIKKRLKQFCLKLVINADTQAKQLNLDFSRRLNEVYKDASSLYCVETEKYGLQKFNTQSKASVYLYAIKNAFVF